jgi:hypothetical protein
MDDSTGATGAPERIGSVNINTAFPSKYVKAAEIPEEGLVAAIDRVDMEDVDGKGSMKPVLYFRGGPEDHAVSERDGIRGGYGRLHPCPRCQGHRSHGSSARTNRTR